MFRKIIFTFLSMALTFFVHAQDSPVVKDERAATGLRAEGKIYVVLVVSTTILIGLFIYLIRLDKKLTRLERK